MWFGDKELSKFSPLRLTYWLFYAENAISIVNRPGFRRGSVV